MFPENPILRPEILDEIVLVAVHPASEGDDEELQRRRHGLRLLGRLGPALTLTSAAFSHHTSAVQAFN